jgi:hypothetical protein
LFICIGLITALTRSRTLDNDQPMGLWVMNGPKATSALSPFDSQQRTLAGAPRRSHSCQNRL